MSQRTKYRKELNEWVLGPDDGDHYAIGVEPPLNRDDVYCRLDVKGRTWGGSSRQVDTRDDAIAWLHEKLAELEQKALDDKLRGSVSRYPEPPKPSNTRYVVHPDYEGEIGPREVWGDATLSSFGVETTSKFEDTSWYETRDAYQEWLAPLRESPGDRVCRVFAQDLTEMAYWWAMAGEDELHWIRYRPRSDRLAVQTTSWTSATRRAAGIGLTTAPPADVRLFDIKETPLAHGVLEDDIRTWIDAHDVEALSKAEANQVDTDGEMPTRYGGHQ
mgnify:CR=1 FL=1